MTILSPMTYMPWEMQIQFWGYEIQGDVANEIAMLAENHQQGLMFSKHEWWDKTAEDLNRYTRYERTPNGLVIQQDVPRHWALPGVTELRIIRDRAFHDIVKELEL